MKARTTGDGRTLCVTTDGAERGSRGPFLPAFRSADRERRYGWFCGHCEGFDVAMDTMGRIECNDCGNRRKPDGWDAAHE